MRRSLAAAVFAMAAGCGPAADRSAPIEVPAAPGASEAAASATSTRTYATDTGSSRDWGLEISPHAIGFVGAPPTVTLGADLSKGVDASLKRSGENDLYVVPIADALRSERAQGRLADKLRLRVDPTTTYRIFFEVLYTAGQTEVEHFAIERNGAAVSPIEFSPPTLGGSSGGPTPRTLGLVVVLVPAGVSLKMSGGNVAPGCASNGPGLALPRAEGSRLDAAAIRACAERVKAADPAFANETTVVMTASPMTPMGDVFDTLDALRTTSDGKPLFPVVQFGVTK